MKGYLYDVLISGAQKTRTRTRTRKKNPEPGIIKPGFFIPEPEPDPTRRVGTGYAYLI